MRYILVWADYMSSGLRDEFEGEVDAEELGLPPALSHQIKNWVAKYQSITPLDGEERALKSAEIDLLDQEGLRISKAIQSALGNAVKVSYFSEGLLRKLLV